MTLQTLDSFANSASQQLRVGSIRYSGAAGSVTDGHLGRSRAFAARKQWWK